MEYQIEEQAQDSVNFRINLHLSQSKLSEIYNSVFERTKIGWGRGSTKVRSHK